MGSPYAALIDTPETLRIFAEAASPTYNSIPFAIVFVNENCFPLGLHRGRPIFALAGSTIFISVPSATFFNVRATEYCARCGLLVAGSMREPVNRSIGAAMSAIGG